MIIDEQISYINLQILISLKSRYKQIHVRVILCIYHDLKQVEWIQSSTYDVRLPLAKFTATSLFLPSNTNNVTWALV